MPDRPLLLLHPSSHEHETGDHPERVERIVAVEAALRGAGLGWERAESKAATREQLLAVHSADYVRFLEEACVRGGAQLDPDTFVSPGSYLAAVHGAGGAVGAVEAVLGGAASAFSLHRPPGHHALADQAMGFCLFGSAAVAARWALRTHGLSRVLIVDWDVHHGNGTEAAFYDSQEVLFVSIHQSPLWPGSGMLEDVGTGPGAGFNVNLPVPPGAGDAEFLARMTGVVVPLVLSWEPELVIVSAGYDAHADDPLAHCLITDGGFAALAGVLQDACREVDAPLCAVLEGGYDLGALARSVLATLGVLGAGGAGDRAARDGVALPADVVAARSFLARWWPALA